MKKMLEAINQYYSKKVKIFGPVPKGVDWNSASSQECRFSQLLKLIDKRSYVNLLDFGCGYGAFARYLEGSGFEFSYTGMDISSEMIRIARAQFEDKSNITFIEDSAISNAVDYIVASGIFNVKLDFYEEQWRQYVISILDMFFEKSKEGFAFNCLSAYSDKHLMRPDLYYADPFFFFDYCKKHYAKNVALLHDYSLYEFSILVKKDK